MPQPEGAALNFGFSPILTNVGLNLLPDLTQFIGGKVFPSVPVASPSGVYPVWKRGDFLRRNGKQIANYEAVPLAGFATGQGNYSVTNWGLGTVYTARDLADARRGGMTDQQFKNLKTKFVVTQSLLEKEIRLQTLLQTAANWTTQVTGNTSASAYGSNTIMQWDQSASTPVDDILHYKRVMRQLTGFVPNTMVIPDHVMLVLRRNAQVISRVTPGFYGAGRDVPVQVSVEQIKTLFEIDNILTPLGMINTAAEGQTDTLVDIWNDTVWMGYVGKVASRDEPSAGWTFAWTGDTSDGLPQGIGPGEGPQNFGSVNNGEGLFVREYPDLRRAAIIIEGMIWQSPNIVSADMGMTIATPVASNA